MALDFGPLRTEYVGHREIGGAPIDVYRFTFKRWTGDPPPEHRSTYRCVCYGDDLAPYAELAICRALRDGGATQAMWAESRAAARISWQRQWLRVKDIAPPRVVSILNDIHAAMGSPAGSPGVWEIVAWWDDPVRIHFCEVKGPGDRLRDSQKAWLHAGVQLLGADHFSL